MRTKEIEFHLKLYPEDIKNSEYIKTIPTLNDEEDEIARLNACEDDKTLVVLGKRTSSEAIIKCVQQNPKKAAAITDFNEFRNIMEGLNNDFDKSTVLLLTPTYFLEKVWGYRLIKDDYCKMKLTESFGKYDEDDPTKFFDFVKEQLPKLEEYKKVRKDFEKCFTEKQKTKFICSLKDNDMKIALLDNVKELSNQEEILLSFNRHVDRGLEPIDNDVRKMIWEFFEDYYDGEIPYEKSKRLAITLQRTSCRYKEFEKSEDGKRIVGQMNALTNEISISKRVSNMPETAMEDLIHEYAHALSANELKTKPALFVDDIEEGNADLFAEMVINHYYKKHYNAKTNFYVTHSAYNKENSIARTLLAPLEAKGKDKEAIMEYFLGSKEKYYEYVLSKEKAAKLHKNAIGEIDEEEINMDDAYECHKGEYVDLDPVSIYATRNKMLPQVIKKDKLLTVKRAFDYTVNNVCEIYKNISIKKWVKKALDKDTVTLAELRKAEKAQKLEKSNEREGVSLDE